MPLLAIERPAIAGKWVSRWFVLRGATLCYYLLPGGGEGGGGGLKETSLRLSEITVRGTHPETLNYHPRSICAACPLIHARSR